MLERGRRWGHAVNRRLVASVLLLTVVAVVALEALVLGYEAPELLNKSELHDQLRETAASYAYQLGQRYPRGVPVGTLLGRRGQRADPGGSRATANGTMLVVPAVTGALARRAPVTAIALIARDGEVIASSEPRRLASGRPASGAVPGAAATAVDSGLLKGVPGGAASTPFGAVSWTLFGIPGSTRATTGQTAAYLYAQAPLPSGLVNPVRAWEKLGQLSGNGALYLVVALLVLLPFGPLLAFFAVRRLVRRVRRLERATVAVVDGDYTVTLTSPGQGDLGRLEANVATMARQLSSALAAERARATDEARASERSRIAREIHDTISQHLFGLRMIASAMRRDNPHNAHARAIEHISEEALRDMQALLLELRPADLEGAGLASAIERVCDAYRDRLGMAVDARLADVDLPEPIEDALLRVTQEACTNAVRHGSATRLGVSMSRRDGHVELAVCDDGTGFDPAASHDGAGLQHIHDRVRELGGTVRVDSAPGAGTAITVLVPAPAP